MDGWSGVCVSIHPFPSFQVQVGKWRRLETMDGSLIPIAVNVDRSGTWTTVCEVDQAE